MRNLSRKHRKIMALCILLLVSIIGMSFSSPKQEDIQGTKELSLNNNVNQYLGTWKGTYIQDDSKDYPMLITVSQKETNEITAIIEWPKWDCTTRGGGFVVTQQEEGRFASKCISWTELDYIKKKRVVLHGRYIANLVKDNELKGIYILAHNLKQGGTFRLSKVQD